MHTVAPAPDSGSIVASPPPQTRWLLPMVLLLGIYEVWNLASRGVTRWDAWLWPAFFVLLGIVGLFYASRRIVMDRTWLAEYAGPKLLRRYPLAEITAVRSQMNAMKAVFRNGRTITINTMWPGSHQILHHLQSVVDSRAGSAPPVDDWLPVNYLRFPPRCVSCAAPGPLTHFIFAGKRYNVPGMHVTSGYQIPIPACSRCSRRRKVAGFVAALTLMGGSVGLIVAAGLASNRFPGLRWGTIDSLGVLMLIAFPLAFLIVHLASNQVPRALDRNLLHVAAERLGKDKSTVRLWFRDPQLELEVRTLTAENRVRTISYAVGSLSAPAV